MSHVYATVTPSKLTVPSDVLSGEYPLIDPEALVKMRAMSKEGTQWAAAQCVDLSSHNLGHLRFAAIGPNNTLKCVDDLKLTHWSYYFVGWVNFQTKNIQAEVPSC